MQHLVQLHRCLLARANYPPLLPEITNNDKVGTMKIELIKIHFGSENEQYSVKIFRDISNLFVIQKLISLYIYKI